ncbi:MAG: PaaI family thioesterase [Candidatus Macondimonas sp.]
MDTASHPISDRLVAHYAQDGWARFLGVEVNPDNASARLRLAYDPRLLNADGGVVHGGILASLLHDAARLEVAAALAPEHALDALRPLDGQIVYLRPARETDVIASARLLRLGRTLAFATAEVRDAQGNLVAQGQWVFALQATAGTVEPLPEPKTLSEDWDGQADTGRMGALLEANMQKRLPGLALRQMGAGQCVIEVAHTPHFLDATGAVAAGPQLLACDNVGVFAGFGLSARITRMSTAALKLSFITPPRDEPLVVVGCSLGKSGPLIANQGRIYGRDSGRLYAFGSITLAT